MGVGQQGEGQLGFGADSVQPGRIQHHKALLQQGVAEFLAGWNTDGDPRMSFNPVPLTAGYLELNAACDYATQNELARGAGMPREFNPAWIPLIIEGVQLLAKLIKSIRDNRTMP